MRGDVDRLHDIIEAIDAIQRHTDHGRERFDREELVRVWCLHHIEIIGEATARLSDELRETHPNLPWREVIGMRNALVHGYFDVDWEIVWMVIDRDLAPLRCGIELILAAEQTTS